MPRFQTAWQIARDRAQQQDRRLQRVQLARPKPVTPTVALRPSEQVPFTPRPVTILKPVADTPLTLKAFVREEFREAAKKREKR